MRPNFGVIADKFGVVGTLVSTMSCAMCFPAAASLGAAIGLGFLSQWESLFLKILPIFAVLVLLVNALGWLSHRQWQRSALGMVGPVLVLIGRYAFTDGLLSHAVSRGVLYTGLVVMVVFAIWDMVAPSHRRCATGEGAHGVPYKGDVESNDRVNP